MRTQWMTGWGFSDLRFGVNRWPKQDGKVATAQANGGEISFKA
jgi:hypothetical protein